MLKVKIKEVAQSRGLKTAYQLQKVVDLVPSVASRLWKNDFKQISIETLDKLCTALDAEAGDFFVRANNKNESKINE